jgi:hypothetical protein
MHFSRQKKQHWKQQSMHLAMLEFITSALRCKYAMNDRIIFMIAIMSAPNAAVPE